MPEPTADEKLAEAQKAREEMYAKFVALRNEAEQLGRQVEAVRALHFGVTWRGIERPLCDACDRPMPCPTIRALDGEDGA